MVASSGGPLGEKPDSGQTGVVFGRVRRAARAAVDEPVHAAAVLHTYDPRRLASVAAVGLGTAGMASPGTAVDAGGRLVSATSEAVSRVMDWGEREHRRYAPLPAHVLTVVTGSALQLFEWTLMGIGSHAATWEHDRYRARYEDYTGEVGARITLADGLVAILYTRSGPLHRRAARTIEHIVERRR